MLRINYSYQTEKMMCIEKCIYCLMLFTVLLPGVSGFAYAQVDDFRYINAEVNFGEVLGSWYGFGFNYVEAAQTRDYLVHPQDYGGFSLLKDEQKEEIIDLIFGDSGLQVKII
jgi:hypothetical protein